MRLRIAGGGATEGPPMYGDAMVSERSRLAAIVLAAGAGTRFSDEPAGKLLARIDARPVLEHVLSALRAFEPRVTIVVLGFGADAVERSIAWAGERRVINAEPHQGIGSSVRTGFRPLVADASIDGAFIVLGDQPRLRVELLRDLARHAARATRPIVVPRYAEDPGPRNPVLLMRAAWPLIDGLDGDHGLGRLIGARPDLVTEVMAPGAMPDVDEPDDLAALGTLDADPS